MIFFKKLLSILTLFLILFYSNITPIFVYAQEESPTPSPISESSVDLQNDADIDNDIEQSSNTGINEIQIAENTPLPTDIPVGSPVPEVSPSPAPEAVSEITTSDAINVTEIQNDINSNIINSEFIYHTLNLYLPESGNIDLSKLTSNVIEKVYGQDQNTAGTVNVNVISVDNFAYVENVVDSNSDSGSNKIEGDTQSTIDTGDSYSVVSVLNNVNTNLIDSKIHLVTINIFGSLTGNIMLPEFQDTDASGCMDCNLNINQSNTAEVNNQVTSNTNTGNNSIQINNSQNATGSGEIDTGKALSSVNVLNLVNSNFINTFFRFLYIKTLGIWVGDYLGWMDDGQISDDNIEINSTSSLENQSLSSCTNCSQNSIEGKNMAVVDNKISSSSNTGNNLISSSNSDSVIRTGNAYSSVSLVNLVNTNVIDSTGFIGFINIFGSLVGDIGGTSLFTEEVAEPEIIQESTDSNQLTGNQKESGGMLSVSHTNNVGTHVLPGDTVTFLVDIKNSGLGKVYDTKLLIELFKDGKSYGGTYFNIGDINAQKTVKLTTGLVMSKNALSGKYIARVTATGIVGPEDHEISNSSESEFKIIGFNTVLSSSGHLSVANSEPISGTPEVLGLDDSDNNQSSMVTFFGILFALYLVLKSVQKRQLIMGYVDRLGSLLI